MKNLLNLFICSMFLVSCVGVEEADAFGGSRPDPKPPRVTPDEPDEPSEPPRFTKNEIDVNGLVEMKTNFDLDRISLPGLTPQCLKENDFELIALDPGHDDTSSSRRSDAKVRGGNGRYVFLWPKVHEGQLNMVTALMTYHYLTTNKALTSTEQAELRSMIRLSRYPGESSFSEYEMEAGYSNRSPGDIDWSVTNRRQRVNQMLREHRFYSSTEKWSRQKYNVQEQAISLSIHANSTTYFDEGDFAWMIKPQSTRIPTLTSMFQDALADGFDLHMGEMLTPRSSDSRDIFNLKRDIQFNWRSDKMRKGEHSVNLAMLRTDLGTSSTLKLLSEGFVMNGKAGHIAHLEMNSSSPKFLNAYRKGSKVMTYAYTSVYDAYARSLAQGIANLVDCR